MRRAVLLVVSLFLSNTASAQSQPQPAGEVRALVPTGYIQRGAAPQAEAKRRDPIFWQDVVRTERGGRVRIGLLDGSILNVASASQLQITQHDAASQSTAIDLAYGSLRAKAVRLAKPGSQFIVRTPVAHAGVVGTLFFVRVFADFTEILCLEGSVRVRNRDESVVGEVLVRPGQYTRVARGLPPTPPAPASPEQVRDADQETALPTESNLSRVEISWPPPACGVDAHLLLRGWSKQVQEGREVELPVDAELLTGSLLVSTQTVFVEGGRASLLGPFSSEPPDGAFTPAGRVEPVPTKIWAPLEVSVGEGWRAPRAVFVGSAFYVLGPMGLVGTPEFRFADSHATLLWQGPCGAGFLAPRLPGGEYNVSLSLSGTPVARGGMNLVDASFRIATPPAVTRGQQTSFGVDLQGLAGLDRFTDGRPVITVVLTNRTPGIIADLRSSTRGAIPGGNTITFPVSGRNITPAGTVRLDGSARGLQAGAFNIGVDFRLDAALEKPRTALMPVTQP